MRERRKRRKDEEYIKTQSSQIFRSSSSALPSALPDLDSASASAAHVGNTDVTGPRDLYITRERGRIYSVWFCTTRTETRRILLPVTVLNIEFTKMSSTEAGKSPPAKRRRTVADVKVQTIMTQEEIDQLDSPVWTVSFLFYK